MIPDHSESPRVVFSDPDPVNCTMDIVWLTEQTPQAEYDILDLMIKDNLNPNF
jgi:hypothetical protein